MIMNMKNQSRRKKILRILTVLIFCLFALTAVEQNNAQTRSITSDDFVKKRPPGKQSPKTGKKHSTRKRTTTYKIVRQDKNFHRVKSVNKQQVTKKNSASVKLSEIGVTIWKVRPPRISDNGFKIPVLDTDKIRRMWTAERVDLNTIFNAGDLVRLAVESSTSGYLYIINSEIYKNGTYGEPFLIFPAVTTEDNSVQSGLLVDIPDQTEDLPYFVINPKKDEYRGELLTVIVSTKPLLNLKTDSNGKIKNLEMLIDLEENADSEVFSRADNANKIYSQAEAHAACGAKVRQQSIRQLERPCGAQSRQLTRDEPLPQTIYQVKTTVDQPAVIFIRLKTDY